MTALLAAARRTPLECWRFVLRTLWLCLLTSGAAYCPTLGAAGHSGGKRSGGLPGVVDRFASDQTGDEPSGEADVRQDCEVVFLLHGICRSSLDMAFLAGTLRREGYEVVNWSYPSTRFSLEKLADRLATALESYEGRRISFVTHSMGGIVVRTYLAKYDPPNVGRFVMIGTPNQGAFLADMLGDWMVFRILFGPSGQQLRQGGGGGCSGAGVPACEFGVIAGGTGGAQGMNPIIPGDNDGTVSVDSTRLDGMRDFLVLPYGHTYLQFMPRTVKNAVHFLRNGRFAESAQEAAAQPDPEAIRAIDSEADGVFQK